MKPGAHPQPVNACENANVRSSGPGGGLIPVLGYARVSTRGQFDEDDLSRQLERIQLFAQRRGLNVIKIFQEVAHGALSSPQDRPALHDCLSSARALGCKVLTTSPSRLSRSTEHSKHLYVAHPDRFAFVAPLPGYEGRPWHFEVAEHHAAHPELTQTGTVVAMDKQRRDGKKFGAGDGGVAGRSASAEVLKASKRARIESIADILAQHPDWSTMTRREAASYLNDCGHRPANSTPRKPTLWSKGSITRPLGEAKTLLHARSQAVPVSSVNHTAGPTVSPADNPNRTQFHVCGNAEDEIVVTDESADVLGLVEAKKRGPSMLTGVTQPWASCGPLRGAAEARADTDNSGPFPVQGLEPSAVNQGSACRVSSGQPDPVRIQQNAFISGGIVKHVELTYEENEELRAHKHPLWGIF